MSAQFGSQVDFKELELFDPNSSHLQPDLYYLLYLCERPSLHAQRRRGRKVHNA